MILVTGATGRVGFRLMEALSDAGADATAMVRVQARAASLPGPAKHLVASLDDPPPAGVLELQHWIRDRGAGLVSGDVRELTGREPRPIEPWLEEFRADFLVPL